MNCRTIMAAKKINGPDAERTAITGKKLDSVAQVSQCGSVQRDLSGYPGWGGSKSQMHETSIGKRVLGDVIDYK
jgi:hypothetical protein